MNRIDRLIIKARESVGLELTLAMVERCGNLWTALAHLWNRRKGSPPGVEENAHATLDAAIDRIHDPVRDYPNTQDVAIIMDDISTE